MNEIRHDVEGAKIRKIYLEFSSLTILQTFSPEITLIHDQVWINVGAYTTQSRSYSLGRS